MTLEALESIEREYLKCDEIAGMFGVGADTLRDAAREGKLPFPAMALGNQVRIPKRPFIRFMLGELPIINVKE